MTLYYPPTSDFIQKTLDAQLSAGATSSATLNNTTALQNKAGVMIIDRVDVNGVETPNKVEVIPYTATSGSTVTGLTRGSAGTSDQGHEVGAIVEFGPDVIWAQGIIDTFLVEHGADGTHASTITKNSASQTLTNKTLTSPIINTGVSGTAIDTDGTLAANSDMLLASQKAVKTYVDAQSGATTTIGMDVQDDTSNSNITATIQAGWGQFDITSGASTGSDAVTLPSTFPTSVKSVIVTLIGTTTGTANSIDDFTTTFSALGLSGLFGANSITTSGFTVSIKLSGNVGATTHVGYSWIAIGN